MDKVYRRTQIVDLLRNEEVDTQDDLRRKLKRRGIHVTQATVSRDIEELGLVKTRSGYRLPGIDRPMPPIQPLTRYRPEGIPERGAPGGESGGAEDAAGECALGGGGS